MPDPEPRARGWKIALWGPSQSGKTALLIQLLQKSIETDWQVRPEAKSLPFVASMGKFLDSNRFPPPTGLRTGEVVYRLTRRDGLSFILEMEDRAGGEWTSESALFPEAGTPAPAADSSERSQPVREVLATADGLVVLIHPTSDTARLEQQVRQTFLAVYMARAARQPELGRDPRPVAVCLSKVDILVKTPKDLRRLIEDPEAFVLEQTSPSLVKWVRDHCADFKLFAVSAVGVRLRFGAIEPLVLLDETLLPRISSAGRPLNLMAPFEWIISKLEARA